MNKKAHKTRRQIQAEKAAQAIKLVKKANLLSNPLQHLTDFHKYTSKDGSIFELTCDRVMNLPDETVKWIFDLMERNMKKLYEESSWGWNEDAKHTEMTENSAYYLIATSEGKKVGFSHFRFDTDDDIEILYCYELQLEPSARRKGLGRFMMQTLEAMAAKNQMQKVVLTVLRHNPITLTFFHKLGYKQDTTNPSSSEGVDYAILSKQNLRLQKT
ncbi:N-alpha-acetyltransferase 40 isoform X2 [Phymastichus coffea]|uniref:N-alpha-acetyltransferase 40 isoform X2 n=1 Tax=Phymastichus coffea TaxID=108790 RepID=UPI00273A9846|nr:N-alpha-acetyltransferase 40 isoform X2 [Phymastichus coffea]